MFEILTVQVLGGVLSFELGILIEVFSGKKMTHPLFF